MRFRVSRGVPGQASTVVSQRGPTHIASWAATPTTTWRGCPYHRASPSARQARARGCWGSAGRRALRIGPAWSCTNRRLRVGPARTPIHNGGSATRFIISVLLGVGAWRGPHDRRGRRQGDDAGGQRQLGRVLSHFLAERLLGPVAGLAGSMGEVGSSGVLIQVAGRAPGGAPRRRGTGGRTVPLPAIAEPAQKELLPAAGERAQNHAQRIAEFDARPPPRGAGGQSRRAVRQRGRRIAPLVIRSQRALEVSTPGPRPLTPAGPHDLPQLGDPRQVPAVIATWSEFRGL